MKLRHHDEETATPARARDIIVIMIGAVLVRVCGERYLAMNYNNSLNYNNWRIQVANA